MITLRRADERGHARHGWLESRHTFSFADYHDPRHMGFRALRVINEDRVAPGAGFGAHPHRDMEILSYVLAGSLQHRDSMGTGSVIQAGELQRMTAGTGVVHSERNASTTEPVHFLQIWLLPERRSLRPGYEQRAFSAEARRNRWALLASRDGAGGSVTVHQDARLFGALLAPGLAVSHRLAAGRGAWLHVARGSVRVGEHTLSAGDALAVEREEKLVVEGEGAGEAELLLFDLA